MTPTLLGRWETRLLLLGTIGLVITLFFGRLYGDFTTTLAILGYVIALGFVWDVLYTLLQKFRWDRDWPPAFQLGAGIVEGALVWALIGATALWAAVGLEGLPNVDPGLTFGQFLAHYSAVWVTTFLASQGLLRLIFPRWRFRGGQWL